MTQTICLNMIVKNESHIIKETLTKLLDKIKIDYYVICDTGSQDDTVEIIRLFFKNKSIDGEIYLHDWKNFGYNRTLALRAAYKKSDYVLIFDADDYIEGNFVLPVLKNDAYMLNFGNRENAYERMCLVKNTIQWEYKGVLHEYITTQQQFNKAVLHGDYYIVSGRTSSRNKDPDKYNLDAQILEQGYHESLKNGDTLHHRYAYYCANSYYDAGKREKAIEWYETTLKSNGWFDEKYNSCLRLYSLTNNLNHLVESYYHNPKRVEGVLLLIRHYACLNKYSVAMGYYNFIKTYYETEYPSDNLNTKLFANVLDYTFYLPYFMVIVCERNRDYKTGLKMFEIIFEKRAVVDQWWINNLLFNLKFYDYNSLKGLQEYLQFLEKNGLTVDYKLEHLQQFCRNHYDILIYTGFSDPPWNSSYIENNAIGGSEKAVIYLSKLFPKHLKIVISGDVIDSVDDNIRYIHRFKINKTFRFDTVIVSRYVSFFAMFDYLHYNKLILMAHDISFLNNITGSTKPAKDFILENISKIDQIVYLTPWQQNYYENVTHPECKGLQNTLINNGIELNLFPNTFKKITNSFVYTSTSDRGLKRLLELWPSIIEYLPDATLSIASYKTFPLTEEDNELEKIIQQNTSIKHLGKLDPKNLYSLMDRSEYWLYPCSFQETSCITALEMLASGVICLYYPIAGLADTMKDYGIQIQHGNEIETLLKISLFDKIKLKQRGLEYARSCSWKNRVNEWIPLITPRLVFYASRHFNKPSIEDYVNALGAVYITDRKDLLKSDRILIVHEFHDNDLFKHFDKVYYFNTEPLNHTSRLNYFLETVKKNNLTVYDYSLANIKILNKNGVKNTVFLEYPYYQPEVERLKKVSQQIYDFGILNSATAKPGQIEPPRRKKVVESLIANGFSVNVITAWGEERDDLLAKCRTILNIHGQHLETESKVFEHIRCNRLINAGYSILSEECIDQPTGLETVKFIPYNDFFKLKPKKIIDTLIFYNEIDMLSYRLNVLNDFVDYFVIVESTTTFMGRSKKLYYKENEHLFEKFASKIVHIVVDEMPYRVVDVENNEQWLNEQFQRNSIVDGLSIIEKLNVGLDFTLDFVILADVDEIPDPKLLTTIKMGLLNINTAIELHQDFYYYNIECRMNEKWVYSKIINYNWFLDNTLTLDDIRKKPFPSVNRAGWHLSYFGTPEFISNKIENFSHQEYNNEDYNKIDTIRSKIENYQDLYNRGKSFTKVKIHENDYLPPKLNLIKF